MAPSFIVILANAGICETRELEGDPRLRGDDNKSAGMTKKRGDDKKVWG